MSTSGSGADPLGQLADEFLERHRRGERPALTEYTARHPELASQIRELFPALLMLEDVRPERQPAPGEPLAEGPPLRLGEYRIVRVIGRGGMGVVYEAEQESLGRRVALKVLPPGALGDARHVERFQREARAAARLHHTNIVPVFAVGEEGGTHYYVMQYIEGRPLDDVLSELRKLRAGAGPEAAPRTEDVASGARPDDQAGALSSAGVARSLWQGRFRPAAPPEGGAAADPAEPKQTTDAPAPRASRPPSGPSAASRPLSNPHGSFARSVAQLGVQVAEALEYAAGQGVLHRDVKPANILLDVWGTAWLTDFGLAKAVGTPDLTRPGDVVGTLRYLAPERFEGCSDVRSDVYALGLTLYEVLALRPAFDGHDEPELVRRITTAEATRLDRIDPRLPRDLATIVHKAMAREPGERYQTAGDLAEDLRRFLDDRSILARRASALEQCWRWCRRNRMAAALLATLLALFLLAGGGALWFERQQADRRAEAAHRQGLAQQAVEEALERADPRSVRGRWQEALTVLAQADNRLDEAGSDDLRRRVAQTRADLKLAARLEQIRLDRASFVAGEFAQDTAERDYEAALTGAGLDVTSTETAERIRRSAIREQLVAALDDWALTTTNELRRWLLMELAGATDPDPQWRNRLPGLLVWDQRAALERLAAEAPVADLSPQFLTMLGVRLRRAGANAEPFLRTAQRLHPADFWLNYDLGLELLSHNKPAAAAGFFRAALAVRPDCSHVHNKLGMALIRLEQTEEALAAYHRAVDLDSRNTAAHYNLADALSGQGKTDEALKHYRLAAETADLDRRAAAHSHNKLAIALEARGQIKEATAEYRRSIACDPQAFAPHQNLGTLLADQGHFEEAKEELRRAIACAPGELGPHLDLGRCLHKQGYLEPAIKEYRRAVDLSPEEGVIHFQLGKALQARGRADEAITHLRKAVQCDLGDGPSHVALADTLLHRGRLAEARKASLRALDRLADNEARRPDLKKVLEQCDRLLALDAQLPAILRGDEPRGDAGERLAQAQLCRDHGRPYAAARLYAAAFAARPALADDLGARHRYDAACSAVRAAADEDSAEGPLTDAERAGLRRQALDWLRADLALWTKQRASDKAAAAALKKWQTDAALAAVRDTAPLGRLPADEGKQWQRLWADVDAVVAADPHEQGREYVARREWSRAAEYYARALKVSPTDDGHFWFEYAAVLLLSDDRPGYARACARMVERCGQKAPGMRAYLVARACTLAPDSVADAAAPGRLAQKELNDNDRLFWSLTEQGALKYREGRFAEAVDLFEKSLRADPQAGRAVLNWLWLALANQRLGKAAEARRWLDRARDYLDQFGDGLPSRAEDELGLHLHNWLEAHVLLREAEALLETGPAKPK
jgi:tetratricopeptide (TPR) repeat protein